MPQFTSFPALQAETVDVPAIRRQAQQDRSQQTTDALNQARLQELQGAPGRRSQTQAMEKVTKNLTAVGNMLQVVESAPQEQREKLFQAARQQAQAMGMDLSNVPESYDGNWSRMTIARAGIAMAEIKEKFETVQNPYGLGGVGQQSNLSGKISGYQAPPGASGSDLTALQKDVPYIARIMGISLKKALALKTESRSKSYDAFMRDMMGRFTSSEGGSPERIYEKSKAVADLAYGRTQPPEAEPDSKEGKAWYEELYGFFSDDETEAAKPTRGAQAANPSAAKKGTQDNPHVPETQADFDAIKSGEIYTDPDDKKLYRKP